MNSSFPQDRTFYPEAFYLGFLLIGTQILLIREFLMIFYGNELVIGLVFAIWMLLTAFGAWLGKYLKVSKYQAALIRLMLIIVAVFPVLAAFAVEYFRNDLFAPGRMISPLEITLLTTVVLFVQGVAGGMAFNLINRPSLNHRSSLQMYYTLESLGSLTGGMFVSILLIYVMKLNNLLSLQYLALFSMIFYGITDYRLKKFFQSFLYLLAAIGFMHLIYNYDLDVLAKKRLFPDQDILTARETPFGNLVVTQQQGQINYFENGILSFVSDDPVGCEESVHFPLLQRPGVQKVLLIGGGNAGILREVLKYPKISRIDRVESNPEHFLVEQQFMLNTLDSTVHHIVVDPVVFVKRSDARYDAIIINQPAPSNVQLNRFYTLEFFQQLQNLLGQDGILSLRTRVSSNYLNETELNMQSSIFQTLKQVFHHVVVVPGSQNYFLASDDTLSLNYIHMLEDVELKNQYINSDYMDVELLMLRAEQILDILIPNAEVNKNFKPVAYRIFIDHWLSRYGINIWIFLGLFLLGSALLLLFSRPAVTAMLTSGFTGAAAEVSLIIAFQVIFGYAYLFIGLIITSFMAGLALGAWLSRQCDVKKGYKMMVFIQFFSGIYMFVVALKLHFMHDFTSVLLLQVIFVLMIIAIATLVGLQYGISVCQSKASPGVTVSRVYSADLVGAASGSLLVTLWLIPELGLLNVMALLGGLHLFTILLVAVKRKMNYF